MQVQLYLHQHHIFVNEHDWTSKTRNKAFNNGVDIICAQESESGGHAGAIATTEQ